MDFGLAKALSSNETAPSYTHAGGVIASIFIALLSFLLTCIINALATTGPNSECAVPHRTILVKDIAPYE